MAEMKASLILELVDKLAGKERDALRSIDRLENRTSRFAASSGGMRAATVRSGTTVLATTRAQTKASEKLNASAGRYNALMLNLRRRSEGGGPSAAALTRTIAQTRATDQLARATERAGRARRTFIAYDARRTSPERVEQLRRRAQILGVPLNRYNTRPSPGERNTSGIPDRPARQAGRPQQAPTAEAQAAARPSGVVLGGAGAALAGRAGLMMAGAAGAAGLGATGIIAASTPNALSLERAMQDVRRSTRASTHELASYQEQVLRLARATGRTKEEIAGLMASGASDQRRGQDLADYAALAARASQAWGERANKTGETLSALGNIYRANQQRLEGIADAIQAAANATRTRATDIGGFLRSVGQSGVAAGMTAEQLAAYGASLRQSGSETPAAQKAMSSIVDTFSQASDQGRDFDRALRGMGLRTRAFAQAFRRDANGTILDFLERLQRLAPDKRNDAISNIFGNDQAEEIRRLAQQVSRIRDLQAQLNDRNRTRGAVRREFDIISEADFAKLERAQQAIDVLTARLGRLGKVAGGAVAEVINRSIDALEPSQRAQEASREEAASRRLGDLERQLAEARAPGGLAARAAGLETAVAAARREWEEATRQIGREPGFRSEQARIARGLEPTVAERRDLEQGLRRNVERHGPPIPRPAEARTQDAAAMRAELERTEAAIRAIEDRLPSLRQSTVGSAFNAPERGALTQALTELDRLQAKAAEIEATMKSLFGPEFSSGAGSAAQEAAGRITSALDGAAASAHSAGQKISAQLAAGIRAGGGEVSAAMQDVAGRAMRNVPQSPAREGPFRNLGHAGRQIVTQLAAGMTGSEVSDRMRSVADAAMSAARPNAGAWPLPRRSAAGEASIGGGAGGGGGDRSIHVEFSGGITISPGGQSPEDAARVLGQQVAARLRSALHESRA